MTQTGNPISLEGRSIVVLGGTSGIGLSAVNAFIAAGAQVVAVGLKADGQPAAENSLAGTSLVMMADARDPQTAEAAVAKAVEVFGKLDGLYHVAGGSGRRFGDGPLHEVTDEAWQATLELNLTAMFYSNRAAVRQFLRQNRGGSILNLSSVVAFSPSPRYFTTHAYAAAKAAVIGLTRSCAALYAAQSIRFNVIAPGLIATPMSQRAQASEDIRQFIRSKQPLDGGRIGRTADLDAAAVYFLSDASKFVTGQVLAVDGGWTLSEGQISALAAQTQRPQEATPQEEEHELNRNRYG